MFRLEETVRRAIRDRVGHAGLPEIVSDGKTGLVAPGDVAALRGPQSSALRSLVCAGAWGRRGSSG
jgi:hypothetical protein